jgi:hypothetical protein
VLPLQAIAFTAIEASNSKLRIPPVDTSTLAVAAVRHDAASHIRSAGLHTSAICVPKDFSLPIASTGIVSLPFVAMSCPVVDRILVERCKLGEARMHCAGERVQLSVVSAGRFAVTFSASLQG